MLHILAIAAALLFALPADAATLRPGDLIKASGPAVYYYTGEKRLVFPNDKIYRSWYADFSLVRTVTDAELAAVGLGGNVTYRPGSTLVKITTDPKVYAVDADATLRWVQTEAVATALYGADWARRVHDLSDAFFVNYRLGAPIASTSDFSPAATMAAHPTILPGVATLPPPTAAAGTTAKLCAVPAAGQVEDVSHPNAVVGTGTAASCTAAAFEAAVQKGGVITFNCGPDPVTIALDHEIRLQNIVGPEKNGFRVIDGGGKVTLSGGGKHRILYQNACEQSLGWLNAHCNNSLYPRLVVQNLTFADGKTTHATQGGGAIFSNGGSLKVVNSVFRNNAAAQTGPDVGGGAIYATLQYGPVYVTNSTFTGNSGSNGGAVGSIFTSFHVFNTVLSGNRATGHGMNPAQAGTPGGGNGGAIATDGNSYDLNVCGTEIVDNASGELGGAIFYVANDLKGHVSIDRTTVRGNDSGAPWGPQPGVHEADTYLQTATANIAITDSTFQE